MSGPDEELGVNEPPSGHINGKCYQTLKITNSYKAAEVNCTCWEAKWTEAFLTIVTESVHSRVGKKRRKIIFQHERDDSLLSVHTQVRL